MPQHDHGKPAAHHDQQQGKAQQTVGLLRTAESAAPEQKDKAGQYGQQYIKEPARESGQSRQHKTKGNRKGRAGLLPAVAQAGQRQQCEGCCQGLWPHKGRERRKNGRTEQQHAASQCGLAVKPGNPAQHPHGHKTQQAARHGCKGKEQMGKLRGKFGKQGIHATQKPEKHGPLGKTITGRRKPHAALRGLHKGHDARCLAGAVNAVSHEGRPCLGQHDEQQGQRACKTCSIKNFVAKAGNAGLEIR